MNEMDYSPAVIEVKRGEQIRFVIRNAGTEAHEFLLATTAENLKHGEAMKKNPDMEHDEPNGLRLAAKKQRCHAAPPVRMDVDKPWSHHQPSRVDANCGLRITQSADRHDRVAANPDVRVIPGIARAIHDVRPGNQNVEPVRLRKYRAPEDQQ